jgi:hypothetical protein
MIGRVSIALQCVAVLAFAAFMATMALADPPTPAPVSTIGATAQILAANSTARVQLTGVNPPNVAIAVCNDGTTNIGYFKLGDSTVTAATTDTPVGPGRCAVTTLGSATYLAAITASSTTQLDIYQANGGGIVSK